MGAVIPSLADLTPFCQTEKETRILEAYFEHGGNRPASNVIGYAESTIRVTVNRVKRRYREVLQGNTDIGDDSISSAEVTPVEVVEHADTGKVQLQGRKGELLKLSDADVLELAGVCPKKWVVTGRRYWQVTMKGEKRQFTDKNGVEVTQQDAMQLWNAHFTLKRSAPKELQETLEKLVDSWAPSPLESHYHTSVCLDPHMIELDFHDAHFGKLSHSEKSTDEDLDQSVRDFELAFEKLISRCESFEAEKYLMPIGNDFFQVDNRAGTTTKGTPVSADERFHEVFAAGFDALVNCIERLAQNAPVDVKWCPGNHDLNTSYAMMWALSQRFKSYDHVDFTSFTAGNDGSRVFVEYGDSVVQLQHGDKMKPERALITAHTGFPAWSSKKHRYLHMGHFHGKKEFKYLAMTEEAGTIVRYLSSLSSTDRWHYENGYVGNKRAATAFIYHPDEGIIAELIGEVS